MLAASRRGRSSPPSRARGSRACARGSRRRSRRRWPRSSCCPLPRGRAPARAARGRRRARARRSARTGCSSTRECRLRSRPAAAALRRPRTRRRTGSPAQPGALGERLARGAAPERASAVEPRRDAARAAPTRATPGSISMRARRRISGPGRGGASATGVGVEIPEGYAGLVLPRSGLAREHGIALVNAPGLIDSGYRGELRVLLLNTDPAETFRVEPGDRIAQLVIVPVASAEPVEVEALSRLGARRAAASAPAAGSPSGGGPRSGSWPVSGRGCRRRRWRRRGMRGGPARRGRGAASGRGGRDFDRACSGSGRPARWRRRQRRPCVGRQRASRSRGRAMEDAGVAGGVVSSSGGGGGSSICGCTTGDSGSGSGSGGRVRRAEAVRVALFDRLAVDRRGSAVLGRGRSEPCRSPRPQSIAGSASPELARIESLPPAAK